MKVKKQGLTKKQSELIEQIKGRKGLTQASKDARIKAIKTAPSPEEQYQEQEKLAKEYGYDLWLSASEEVGLHHLSGEEQKEFRELWYKMFHSTPKEWKGSPDARRLIELRDKIKKAMTPGDWEWVREQEEKRELSNKEFLAWTRAEINRLSAEGYTPEQIGRKVKQSPEKVIEILSEDKREIDIDTIELIHGIERQQDGYVSFCRKINDDHQDLAGIKITELRQHFPQIQRWLLRDAYFSVNASWRAAPYINKRTGLPSAWRQEKRDLRYLNACYCDLDCYKANLKWSQGVQLVMQAQDDNIIPPASIIGRSGRGVYLLWLLTSERLGAQQRAFPQEIALYKQINKAIISNLDEYRPELSIDKVAFDASRILRIPGSVHTKADAKVIFMVQVVQGGRVPTYTLGQLAQRFEIPVMPPPSSPSEIYLRPIKSRGSAPARRKGKIATGNYRLSDLLTLAQHRGGFKQGKRWKSISNACYFAKAAGYTLRDIEKQARKLAKKCQPPYPSDKNDTPISEIVKAIWVRYTPRFNNDYLARFFDVTPELADELDLHSIIPAKVARERAKEPSQQAQDRTQRRKIIKQIICKQPGNIPSLRKLKARLEHKDLSASVATIKKDFDSILIELKSVQKPLPYK